MTSAPVPLSGPRFQTEPAELYREMRRDHGSVASVVLDGDIPAWLVLGYRELHQVTGDPVLFSRDSDLWNQWDRIPDDWPLLPMIGRKQNSILYTVGERHRERAAMISEALEAVDPFELRTHAERFADELIDAACAKGEIDLVGDYAALLPVRVLATLYGFSEEQGPGLVTALNDMINGREGHSQDSSTSPVPWRGCWPTARPTPRTTSSPGCSPTPPASPTRRSSRT